MTRAAGFPHGLRSGAGPAGVPMGRGREEGQMIAYRTMAAALALGWAPLAPAAEYFAIRVVDAQTGRGVPLIELRTVHNVRCYTDSAGLVAFHEPGLMGREVYFFVEGHGYEYPADGFGFRGVRLTPEPGGQAEIKVQRVNVAERLYRVTGGGIYRDSVLLGRPVPLREPVLNGLVLGQDSVQGIVYRGQVRWFWGDTGWPAYPLGNFQMSGATSRLPADGGLAPDVGVDLTYFVDERGFSKPMAPVPGDGPTWADGLMTVRDADGRERLVAVYAKVRPDMTPTQRGFLEYDDQAEQFRPVGTFPVDAPLVPGGHPFRHVVGGTEYYYHPRGFPLIRVPAERAAVTDLARYEAYTCLQEGCRAEEPVLDRDAQGRLRYAWKPNTAPLYPQEQEKLLKAGTLRPEEARFRLADVATGRPVVVHGVSVAWNEYRQRWIAIVLEIFGTSVLGELWYAEADTPLGPWCYARKIVTHERYSFYNPRHHPFFDEDGGRRIYFEATYTVLFSGNPAPTPRYDYNQIMYRLDLADPRVNLPVPIYRAADGRLGTKAHVPPGEIPPEPAFLALDRPLPGAVAVRAAAGAPGPPRLAVGAAAEAADPAALFYALPPDAAEPAPTTALLYEYASADGREHAYGLEGAGPPGWTRAERPLCRVWRDPHTAAAEAPPEP